MSGGSLQRKIVIVSSHCGIAIEIEDLVLNLSSRGQYEQDCREIGMQIEKHHFGEPMEMGNNLLLGRAITLSSSISYKITILEY